MARNTEGGSLAPSPPAGPQVRPAVRAELVMIGTEMLLGEIVDSNAARIAQRLAALGIHVYFKTTVGDNWTRMALALSQALSRADIVITSGGLGPTQDDLTREVVAAVLGVPLVEDPEALAHVEGWFRRMQREMPASNRKQALVPQGAVVIPNPRGTAPGIIARRGHQAVICLPGVPYELTAMMDESVIPYLERHFAPNGRLHSRVLKFYGIGESALAERLGDLLNMENPTVATYAGRAEVRVRITARTSDGTAPEDLLAPVEAEVRRRAGEYLYGVDQDTLETVAGRALAALGWTVGLAESCTGGLIAARLTNVPGSSAYFLGSVVAYSNEAKAQLLGVPPDVLAEHGAVSAPVAEAMAAGAMERLGATMGVSVTGIAGPGGGTPEKPVGLVYIGLARGDWREVHRLQLAGDRERIRWHTSQAALDLIRRHAQRAGAGQET
ncbi:MAG: competence/damage-inducible protein A [Limnochordales bacterium]|nr:competence/damage-inducible protein A [Limnochordales bacterium]